MIVSSGSSLSTFPATRYGGGQRSTMVIERAESSIRYRQVEFQDPQEALMLPVSIETLTVIRGVATRRVRMTQRFSDYRRFLTGGRIVD